MLTPNKALPRKVIFKDNLFHIQGMVYTTHAWETFDQDAYINCFTNENEIVLVIEHGSRVIIVKARMFHAIDWNEVPARLHFAIKRVGLRYYNRSQARKSA